jgi:hypothetical protein
MSAPLPVARALMRARGAKVTVRMRPLRGIEEAALVLLFSGGGGVEDEEQSAGKPELVKLAVAPCCDGVTRLHGVEVRVSEGGGTEGGASGAGKVLGKRILSFAGALEEPDEYVK